LHEAARIVISPDGHADDDAFFLSRASALIDETGAKAYESMMLLAQS
jgi:hypothetical protein